jgi:hypothetical protein
MRQSLRLRDAVRLLLCWAALSCAACTSPGSQAIVGPDGSPMAHVHCGSDQGTCFRIAGELCPTGYELKPILSGHDGNFVVRCRAASTVAVCRSGPAVAVLTTQITPAPRASTAGKEHWPPSAEPWPETYPWPPPETNAAVRQAPTPSTPSHDEIDLGY